MFCMFFLPFKNLLRAQLGVSPPPHVSSPYPRTNIYRVQVQQNTSSPLFNLIIV